MPPDPLTELLRHLVAEAVVEAIGPAVEAAVLAALPEVVRRAKLAPYLSREEVADLTGWSMRKVDYLRSNGTLPYVRRGRSVLIRTADVEALLDEAYVPARGRGHVAG